MIANPEEIKITGEVLNLMGQNIMTLVESNNALMKISLENQASGVYFIKLNYNGTEVIKKIVKD
jgi:hypothetical protein